MYQKAINCKQRKGLDACKGKQAKGGEVYFVREGDALLLCIGWENKNLSVLLYYASMLGAQGFGFHILAVSK